MNKIKITNKAAKEDGKLIGIGYCNAQYLLYSENAIAYTAGVYGWNADVYNYKNVTIITGYRFTANISPDIDIVKKYDDIAYQILKSNDYYSNIEKKLRENLDNFITELKEKYLI